jgi:hypothetical protein
LQNREASPFVDYGSRELRLSNGIAAIPASVRILMIPSCGVAAQDGTRAHPVAAGLTQRFDEEVQILAHRINRLTGTPRAIDFVTWS